MFNVFYEFLDYYEIENKYPLRCIEDISEVCKKCEKIFMLQFLDNQECFKCLGKNLTEVILINKKRKFENNKNDKLDNKRKRT